MGVWKCGHWLICFAVLLLFGLFAHPVSAPAQITAALTHWQSSQWWRNTATLDLDFINDRYWLNGTQYSGVSNFITGSGATFSRNSVGTYFNSSGILTTASANVPRLDHSPTSPYAAEGILIEESRTNSITNNTMVGGSAPSTLPSNGWGAVGNLNGLATAYAYGTENGISYIDYTLSGTATASGFVGLYYGNSAAPSQGQTWTNSLYAKLSGGTTANVNGIQMVLDEKSSGCSTFLVHDANSVQSIPTTPLGTTRIYFADALSNSSVGCLTPYFYIQYGTGAINITVRIGMPQLELGAFPTSVIPTSGSAVTRQPDAFTVPTSATGANGAWYTQGVGTLIGYEIIPYLGSSAYNGFVAIDDNTLNNVIDMNFNQAAVSQRAEIKNSGTFTYGANLFSPPYVAGAVNKGALAFQTNNVRSAFNGNLLALGTSASIPTSVTQLNIGRAGGPYNSLDGWEWRITYFPTRQPDYSLPDYTR